MLDLTIYAELLFMRLLSSQNWLECLPSSHGKRMSKAHKVTITKRGSTGIYKVFFIVNGKIYNPVIQKEDLLVCLRVYMDIYMVVAWLWNHSGPHSRSQVEINVTQCRNIVKVFNSVFTDGPQFMVVRLTIFQLYDVARVIRIQKKLYFAFWSFLG